MFHTARNRWPDSTEDGQTIPKWGLVPCVANGSAMASALEGTTHWSLLGDTGKAWGTRAPVTGWCSTFLPTNGPASAVTTARKEGFGGIIPENPEDGHSHQDQKGAIASATGEAAVGTGSRASSMNAIGDDETQGVFGLTKASFVTLCYCQLRRRLVSTVTCVTVATGLLVHMPYLNPISNVTSTQRTYTTDRSAAFVRRSVYKLWPLSPHSHHSFLHVIRDDLPLFLLYSRSIPLRYDLKLLQL